MLRLVLVCAFGATVASCASGTTLDERSNAVVVANDLPAPSLNDSSDDLVEYRVGPTDIISVSVFGADELKTEGMVDAGGSFLFPLVGSVHANGKTPAELSADIADALRGRFIRDPQVVVSIKEARAHSVTVDGSVVQPGVYPVIGRMSLQQAIATARGASDLADTDRVILFRTIDGQRMAALFDLDDIRSGRVNDPQIYGRDTIVVGESGTRRFLKDTQMTVPILARFVPVY